MDCSICRSIANIKSDKDPFFVVELQTGYVTMGWHQHFKGYTLFFCKEHVSELHQLPHDFKMKYLEEMALVAEAVYNVFKPDKMNYELLGNGTSHLHWHLFPRREGDTPQRGPVWWLPREEMMSDANRPGNEEVKEMTRLLKAEIEQLLKRA